MSDICPMDWETEEQESKKKAGSSDTTMNYVDNESEKKMMTSSFQMKIDGKVISLKNISLNFQGNRIYNEVDFHDHTFRTGDFVSVRTFVEPASDVEKWYLTTRYAQIDGFLLKSNDKELCVIGRWFYETKDLHNYKSMLDIDKKQLENNKKELIATNHFVMFPILAIKSIINVIKVPIDSPIISPNNAKYCRYEYDYENHLMSEYQQDATQLITALDRLGVRSSRYLHSAG